MASKSFDKLDLNLLRSYMVIYQVRSTTRAAEILNLSQSAVSRTLQRLREHFDDELMVKVQGGLEPTPRGDMLGRTLPGIMKELGKACNAEYQFNPLELDQTFSIALISPLYSAIGAKLCQKLYDKAPNLVIELVDWSDTTIQDLINGSVNMGVNTPVPHAHKEILQHTLLEEPVAILARPNHPLRNKKICLSDLANYPIASFKIPNLNYHQTSFAQACANQGVNVQIIRRFVQLDTLAGFVSSTNALAPGSKLLSIGWEDKWQPLDFQVKEMNNLRFTLYFHHRHRQHPLYLWVEQSINSILNNK